MVRDEGTGQEPIVVVGEAPGANEVEQNRPFVGHSGQLLMGWLREVGLSRTDVYWTNTYPYRPPNNKIEAVPVGELSPWVDRLHHTLATKCAAAHVIVPTGGTALRALTERRGITRWRGSILAYPDRAGRTRKVIPTLHPAFVLREPKWARRCRFDWARIALDRHTPDLNLPQRTHAVRPTLDDIAEFYEAAAADRSPIALDIETPNNRVACIALSTHPHHSITIPTTVDAWHGQPMLDHVWDWVRAILQLPNAKITHNGLFDYSWLADFGIVPVNWRWDTLAMAHALDSSDQFSLAYLASLWTRQPYWKGMVKDAKDDGAYSGALHATTLWTYNGMDACVTRELYECLVRELARLDRRPFYDRHYAAMFDPLLAMMQAGILIDDVSRRRRHLRLTADCLSLQDQLAELAGEPVHGTRDLSSKRVARFLYGHVPTPLCAHCRKRKTPSGDCPKCGLPRHEYLRGQCRHCPARTLGLPKRVSRETGGLTADETAVRTLVLKYPDKASAAGALILEHREKKKLSEYFDEGVVDPDGRMRTSYRFTTLTGRLSSGPNPKGRGRNLQNIPKPVRDVFVPDDGHVFLEADLSQAESRVVGMLTRDAELIRLARTAPGTFDVHRFNGSIIFNRPADDVSPEQRQVAKRAVHATNYGMGAQTLQEDLLNGGYVRTIPECQAMIEAYLDRFPAIRHWQRDVRITVARDRRLITPFGRVLDLEHERLSDATYRVAYSFVPQSTVADHLNQRGLIPLDAWLRERRSAARIVAQVHDSLLITTPPAEAWEIYEFLHHTLETPILFASGDNLIIFVEAKLGQTWQGSVEFKTSPTRADFEKEAIRCARP